VGHRVRDFDDLVRVDISPKLARAYCALKPSWSLVAHLRTALSLGMCSSRQIARRLSPLAIRSQISSASSGV
jgi:hypothetical protein